MKQLFQDSKSGEVKVVELAEPALRPGTLLVRTACSVISPGTERSTVSMARSSYLATARARPDLVKRVVDLAKREGPLATWERVRNKMSEPRALGYSSAGIVLAIGEGADGYFNVGDRVACAGQNVASHAEVVCVPTNLAAPVPEGVELEHAAFSTLGSIALHGVRQAEATLGEQVAVIGLGIVGLITVQLLVAQGVRVIAFDLQQHSVERALKLGAEVGLAGGTAAQVGAALAWTRGVGVDAVLVTAASASEEPMNAAATMARERARIVAVGLVPFGLPRDVAYAKELELRISRSYGPGRYDTDFEERGLDYPIGYVRWTQTRNLEAFLRLVAQGRVDLESLITHRYPLDEAPAAYDALLKSDEPTLGLVISYPQRAPAQPPRASHSGSASRVAGRLGVSFIGAGAFATGTLLPPLKKDKGVALRSVVTARGLSARHVHEGFGFARSGTNPAEALTDPDTQLVCIATRHDLHAGLVIDALNAGKHVFVEKPLALTLEQLDEIERVASTAPGLLLVGFNRRFSPMIQAIRAALGGRGPVLATYRVNAGRLPSGHWLNDPLTGGGRMVGEGCHFVDLLTCLAGDSAITEVSARRAGRSFGPPEDIVAQLSFANGSVGQLLYTACGNNGLPKERLEVHAGGLSAILDDYSTLALHGASAPRKLKRGKGHAEELRALVDACRAGGPSPIPLATLLDVSRTAIRIQQLATR